MSNEVFKITLPLYESVIVVVPPDDDDDPDNCWLANFFGDKEYDIQAQDAFDLLSQLIDILQVEASKLQQDINFLKNQRDNGVFVATVELFDCSSKVIRPSGKKEILISKVTE